jgi:hemerythrin superfamily protein
MEATEYLTGQHREIERVLREALDTGNAAAKRSRFLDIADALILHVTSEEQVFYPAVRDAPNEDVLLESLEEHLAIKRLLVLPGDDATFQPKLHVLRELCEHHHRDEEKKLFPEVRAKRDAERREALGEQMQALQLEMQMRGKPRRSVHGQTAAAEPLR